jgi:pyridoxine kinase
MARVLILSSFVASSRVGGGAQALALARLGIEPILVPTVLFGRHPGYGAPGGAAVADETFEAMIGGVEAQGLFSGLDAVITGHFSSAGQVATAAEALARVRSASPAASLIVDPIMGDVDKGLYVRDAVAEALAAELVPMADLVSPNAWELGRLTGRETSDPVSALAAARSLGRAVVVSSVMTGGRTGALYADATDAWLASHDAAPTAPKGTGDLLTALFVAALIGGMSPAEALGVAVGGVAEAVAEAGGGDELPIAALPTELRPSPRVTLEAMHG